MSEFIPIHDRVLIKRKAEEEQLGGLYIPEVAKERLQEGTVLAVGDGRILETGASVPLVVKVGDNVLFGKYAGTDIKIDGEEVMILREDEILGILRRT